MKRIQFDKYIQREASSVAYGYIAPHYPIMQPDQRRESVVLGQHHLVVEFVSLSTPALAWVQFVSSGRTSEAASANDIVKPFSFNDTENIKRKFDRPL